MAGKNSPTISRKTFDELMQTEKFRLAIQKLPKTKNASAANARTIMEDQYGFTIVDVPAKMIESDSAISYTLLVRPDSISADFENLVINYNKSTNTTEALILKYNLLSPVMPTIHDSHKFTANVSITPIIYNSKESTQNLKNTTVCIKLSYMLCDHGGETHDAGPKCSVTYMHTETVCTTGGGSNPGGDDSGGGPGNPGGEPGGSGGGAGGGGSGSNPGNNPSGPEAPPIITSPVVDEITSKEQHCVKLKALSQNTSIRNAMSAMVPKVNLAGEYGYKFTKSGVALSALSLPQGDNNSIDIPTGGTIFGAIHSHPNDGTVTPMFSAADIFTLYNIAKRYKYSINNEIPGSLQSDFVFMLTTINGTYALKIDSSLFVAFMNDVMIDSLTRDKFFDDLNKKQSKLKPNYTAKEYEKILLDFIGTYNLPISLYHTENNNLNNWKKKQLVNGEVTDAICN